MQQSQEGNCPLCNGWARLEWFCPVCSAPLTDAGASRDYLGPYSPYTTAGPGQDEGCTHLLTCPVCGYDHLINLRDLHCSPGH